MKAQPSVLPRVNRSKVSMLIALCSVAGAASVGAVSADTLDEVLSMTVHYDQQALATEDGAKMVYHRLVKAAEEVCPDIGAGSRIVDSKVEQCRTQAVARAVHAINNPRLAAVSSINNKRI